LTENQKKQIESEQQKNLKKTGRRLESEGNNDLLKTTGGKTNNIQTATAYKGNSTSTLENDLIVSDFDDFGGIGDRTRFFL